jgi:uncharacterized YigZ family protein
MTRKNILASAATGIYREKGSKFLAYAWPIDSEAAIQPFLNQLKKEHAAARHYCYAWRLGEQGERYRINDDREPSGTAGRPILQQIDHYKLSNCLVVVIRYFGGTLLGVRGLINAYGAAAAEALGQSTRVPMPLFRSIRIHCDFHLLALVQKLMNEWELKPVETSYSGAGVNFLFQIDEEQVEALRNSFYAIRGIIVV